MKAKKYLKGGQVKLDANKDGKISGKDFSMLRKGMKKYQKGGRVTLGDSAGRTKSKLMREPEGRLRRMATRGDKESMDKLDARDKVKFIARNQADGRAQAYIARENNFGIEKPKAKVMKSGGKVVKYQEGGSNPTPTERTYTGDDRRQITASGNQPGADYKGYNKTKTPKEVLEGSEMRRLKSALRKNNYGTNGMSLADMRKVAKTKGIYDEARGLAREDYQKEMDKRKG